MRSFSTFFAKMLAAFALAVMASQPVAAQSVLRDAETEALLADMAAPLIEAAELEPGNVDMVLINDRSINAFVAGGQVVYIHTGLIEAADTAEEVQGVIAHELGHTLGKYLHGIYNVLSMYTISPNLVLLPAACRAPNRS